MRRKKAPDAPLPVAPVDNDDRVKVVERREYVQRITQAPPSDKPPIEILAAPVEEEGDDLLDFLAELEEEIGLSLRVDRLPQFSANGKWNKGAAFEFCDNIPINKSDLKSGQYMAVIRDLYGPAAYRCTLREVGAGIIRSWPIKIAAPMQQAPQPRQVGSSVVYQSQAPSEPPPDTLKQLIDSARQLGELKKLFGWEREPQQVPVTPITPTVEAPPLQDKIMGAAIDYFIKAEKPETVGEFLKSYLNPQPDFSWSEVVKAALPMGMAVLNAILMRMTQGQPQQVQGQPVPPQQGALSPAQQPMLAIQNEVTGQLSAIPFETEPPPGWAVAVRMPGMPDQPGLIYRGETFSMSAPQPPPGYPQPALEVPQNAPVYDTFQPGSLAPAPLPQHDEPEDEDTMAEDDLINTLADMLDDCVRRAVSDPKVIEAGRKKLMEFKKNYPALDRLIGMLVTMPPAGVLAFLAYQYPELEPLVNNPIAVQVITDLQAAIKPETQA